VANYIYIRGETIKESSKRQVYAVIKKHGDSFWNDCDKAGKTWNGFLFDEVLDMLGREGLDLELVEHEKKNL